MRHYKVPKSGKHKKIKGLQKSLIDLENTWEEETPVINLTKLNAQKEKKRVDELKQQNMPRKLQELLDRSKRVQSEPKRKKKNANNKPGLLAIALSREGDTKGATRDYKWLPDQVVQGTYESEDQFINRLSMMSSKAKAEARIENKYGVDFCPKILSTSTGKETTDDPVDEKQGEKKRIKRRARETKLREKKAAAKRKGSEAFEFTDLVDQYKFGEVAMAPPQLPAFKKRK